MEKLKSAVDTAIADYLNQIADKEKFKEDYQEQLDEHILARQRCAKLIREIAVLKKENVELQTRIRTLENRKDNSKHSSCAKCN